jgi:hypothetical protein
LHRLLEHPLFGAAFVAAVVVRVVVALTYRPALLLQTDAYVYLAKAQDMHPSHFRPVFYSFFLKPFLLAGSIAPLAWVQHGLGLAMGVGIYLLLRRLRVGPVGATIGAVPVLFDAYQLNIEQYVLSEALLSPLVVGALVILCWGRGRLGALTAGILLGLAATTRFVGIVALVPALAYACSRRPRLSRVMAVALGAALPVIAYALWFQSFFGTFGLTDRSGHFLYARVGPIARCADLQLTSSELFLCDRRPPSKRPASGFYMWSSVSPLRLLGARGGDADPIARGFFTDVVRQQPSIYARAVARDFFHFFAPGRETGRHDAPNEWWRFPASADREFRPAGPIHRFDASPPPGVGGGPFRIASPLARWVRGYQTVVYTHGPLLAAFVALGLAGATLASPRSPPTGRRRAVCLLFLTAGLGVILVPVATAMFDYRYVLSALPLLPPAGVLGACLLKERFTDARFGRSRRAR